MIHIFHLAHRHASGILPLVKAPSAIRGFCGNRYALPQAESMGIQVSEN